MRFALYSDLHIEFYERHPWALSTPDVDAVILAGDIGLHTQGMLWAQDMFCQGENPPAVIYVAGNHEYYHAHLGLINELRDPRWARTGITFLEQSTLALPGVRILGCTLWSNFGIYGEELSEAAMIDARNAINDYRLIHTQDGARLSPRDTLHIHQQSVIWLEQELSKPFDGKTVVVTHFAPHRGCIAPEHEGSVLTPYFVSDMSNIMRKHKIDVWCFGHTHYNCDFIADGGCRVLSNQRGYPAEALWGNGFREGLVFEV